MVTAKMMQQLWAVIESTQVNTLLHFDDAALVQLRLQQVKAKQVIDAQADSSLNTYIKSKLPPFVIRLKVGYPSGKVAIIKTKNRLLTAKHTLRVQTVEYYESLASNCPSSLSHWSSD